jgi:hypothetical protein
MKGGSKFALLAALAMAAAMFEGWQSGETVVSPAATPAGKHWALPATAVEDADKDMRFLTERHPWGAERDKPGGAQVGPDKNDKMPWRLAGIVERADGRLALIAVGPPGAANLKYCAIGDNLPDGSRLVDITTESATSEGPDPGSSRRTLQLFRGAQAEASPQPNPPGVPGAPPPPMSGRPAIGNLRGMPPTVRTSPQ